MSIANWHNPRVWGMRAEEIRTLAEYMTNPRSLMTIMTNWQSEPRKIPAFRILNSCLT